MASTRHKRSLTDTGEEPPAKKLKEIEDSEEDERKGTPHVSKLPGLNGIRNRHGNDKPAELFRKDLISAMKLADTDQLQPDEYVAISDAWRQDWERGVQVPVNANSIPICKTRYIEENEKLNGIYGFKLPRKILHAVKDESFKQSEHELHDTQSLAEEVCRYDLDDLDVFWLESLNDERDLMGEAPVEEWFLEQVLELVETLCYENMKTMIKTVEGLGIEYDENIVCDVCKCPDSEDTNEMVFCDKCDICVHQACYGLLSIPEGSWLCRTCALGVRPRCVLCPNTGGAMKSTRSGSKWTHVSCALWIPEVSIGCPEKMEPINKISNIPSSRWSLICSVCREREGACIQCNVKTCKTSFHVTCAFQSGFKMDTVLNENAEEEVQLKAYCGKHSKKKDTDVLTPPVTPKKESEMTEEEKVEARSHRLKRVEEEFYTCVDPKEVAEKMKLDIFTTELIYSYWILKRKSNFNKPLMTPKSDEGDVLSKQQEDSIVARMKMFVHLRQDLERVRNLCYMLTKREKTKKQVYKMKEEIFYKQLQSMKAENPRIGSREATAIISAHRLQQSHSSEPPKLSGVFYDDQKFIMKQALSQDESTLVGPFDHELAQVKIKPLQRYRIPKNEALTAISEIKRKSIVAKALDNIKESQKRKLKDKNKTNLSLFKNSLQRERKYRHSQPMNLKSIKTMETPTKRSSRFSLPTKMGKSNSHDIRTSSIRKSLGRGRPPKILLETREEVENLNVPSQKKVVNSDINQIGVAGSDTQLKENVQRPHLRNFFHKLVGSYKSDRPIKNKPINGLIPNSNLIVSEEIKQKVQNKLRRSSRRHTLPNGVHESRELFRLQGGYPDSKSILLHTPPERNAAKKAMAQISPIREKDKTKLFPNFDEMKEHAVQSNIEKPIKRKIEFDSCSAQNNLANQDEIKMSLRSNKESTPDIIVKKNYHTNNTPLSAPSKLSLHTKKISAVLQNKEPLELPVYDHVNFLSEAVSGRVTRSRVSDNFDGTPSDNPISSKISTRSAKSGDFSNMLS